jgi:uncharacterized protein YcgI (DUF1989 family)
MSIKGLLIAIFSLDRILPKLLPSAKQAVRTTNCVFIAPTYWSEKAKQQIFMTLYHMWTVRSIDCFCTNCNKVFLVSVLYLAHGFAIVFGVMNGFFSQLAAAYCKFGDFTIRHSSSVLNSIGKKFRCFEER